MLDGDDVDAAAHPEADRIELLLGHMCNADLRDERLRRSKANAELHQKLNEDLPYVFLWSLDIYSGISKQVKNLFIQPYYYYTFFKEWKLGR